MNKQDKKKYDHYLNRLISRLKMSASEFSVSLGLKRPDRIYHVLNGRNGISEELARDIMKKYDNVNFSWLMTGEGEMLNNHKEEQANEGIETFYVSLLPISAQGGSLSDFVVSVKESECEKIISPIKGADWAITVTGDSMSPEYPSGAQILIKKINEKAFIDWGKVYVLDTCNGNVIKILLPSEKEGHVRCCSINPDTRYAPFDVCLDDVYGIYRVMLCMSVK